MDMYMDMYWRVGDVRRCLTMTEKALRNLLDTMAEEEDANLGLYVALQDEAHELFLGIWGIVDMAVQEWEVAHSRRSG